MKDKIMKKSNLYTVVSVVNNCQCTIKNKNGYIDFYNTFDEADIERIYLQPDYEDILKVIKI